MRIKKRSSFIIVDLENSDDLDLFSREARIRRRRALRKKQLRKEYHERTYRPREPISREQLGHIQGLLDDTMIPSEALRYILGSSFLKTKVIDLSSIQAERLIGLLERYWFEYIGRYDG